MALRTLVLISTCLAIAAAGFAAVKPSPLFSDNAVLQQGIKIPVWGTADDGEKITVRLQGQTARTTARHGVWIVRLDPLTPGGPFTMRINDLEIDNLLVGEVWVCSGQSNMQWTIDRAEAPDKIKAGAADPRLRLLTVPRMANPVKNPALTWRECGPDTVGDFSAVGYHFGRSLRADLKTPVGLISCSWGGTPAETWTSRRCLSSDPALAGVLSYELKNQNRPAALYNAMLSHLVPYGIRGAIWYQGESNTGRAWEYRNLFPAMIRCWRDAWGQGDFPFLFVQLAPFHEVENQPTESAWAELRESQLLTVLGMAVITDYGDPKDIHPLPKAPVGERLALAARGIAYGHDVVYSGPVYRSLHTDGDRAVLAFDHVGGGLVARDGEIRGFTIRGEDRRWVNARAEIVGRTVVVSSPEVTNPVAVRYGWADCPIVNLYNAEGLPASPFRTDNFPMVTQPR